MLSKREKVMSLLALDWHDRFEAFFIVVRFSRPRLEYSYFSTDLKVKKTIVTL